MSEDPVDLKGIWAAATVSALGASLAKPTVRAVTDPRTLVQGADFGEALYQTAPLVETHGRAAMQAAQFLREGTARTRGLLPETAHRLATSESNLFSALLGAHPTGKTAEVVVAATFHKLHNGGDAGMTNPPKHIAPNIHDVRVSPDTASRRDILFQVRTQDGLLLVPGGQVKTGSGRYLADSLCRMANTPGYGRTAYVDARYVNVDGSPRVASDAFTLPQAQRLSEARIKFRGIPDLDERAHALLNNIDRFGRDGSDPVGRIALKQLQDDIALAYGPAGVMDRIVGGAARGAAVTTIVSLAVQFASGGHVTAVDLADAAVKAAITGAVGPIADAAVYHAALNLGIAPEIATVIAQRAVAAGFCLLAIGSDALGELRAAQAGDITLPDALSGTAFKAALNMLPLVLAPLGLVGLPVLVATQVGGRWALSSIRAREARLTAASADDSALVARMLAESAQVQADVAQVFEQCDETDQLFEKLMGKRPPALRLVRA